MPFRQIGFCILFYFVEFWLDKYDLTTTSFFWKITIRYQMIRTPQKYIFIWKLLVLLLFFFCCSFCLVLLLAWVKKYFFLQNFAYLFLSKALFPFSSWFVTKLLDLQLEIVQRATGRTTETKTEMFLLYHVSSREFSFGYRTYLVGCVIHKRMALLLWK